MTNKLKSSLHKAALTTGLLAGIILTNKDALAQNIASNGKSTTQTEETRSNITRPKLNIPASSPLGKIREELKTYPKELQDHYELAMSSFYVQEEIDMANKLIEEILRKEISENEQKLIFSINFIEKCVLAHRISPIISSRMSKNMQKNRGYRPIEVKANTEYDNRTLSTLKPILDAKVNETRQNINISKENINKYEKNINKYEKNINISKENINKYEENINKYEENINKYEENINKYEENINKYEENINKYEENINRIDKQIQELKLELENMTIILRENEEKVKKNEEKVEEYKKDINKNLERLRDWLQRLEKSISSGKMKAQEIIPIRETIIRLIDRGQKYDKTLNIPKTYPNLQKALDETK